MSTQDQAEEAAASGETSETWDLAVIDALLVAGWLGVDEVLEAVAQPATDQRPLERLLEANPVPAEAILRAQQSARSSVAVQATLETQPPHCRSKVKLLSRSLRSNLGQARPDPWLKQRTTMDLAEVSEKPIPDLDTARERYKTTRLLGTGGTSKVWAAHDRKLNRTVAIKRLLSLELGPDRLAVEARLTGRLDHPNILPVHDMFRDERGAICYAMRIASDQTLAQFASGDARYTPRSVCATVRQVALAVQFAHENGVIHRDIKPENILIGAYGEIYLTDWGMALLSPTHPEYAKENYPVGLLVGTPAYMAPEQISGDPELLDPRTDVYGLGATLYSALAGGPPHQARSLSELFGAVIHDTPPPPSTVSRRHAVPRELDLICMKAMAKDKEERFAAARDLADALQSFLDGDLERTWRRKSVETALANARTAQSHYEGFKRRFEQLTAERNRLLSLGVASEAEERAELWELEAELEEVEIKTETAFASTTAAYNDAMLHDAPGGTATTALAELYWERLRDSERSGELARAAYYRGLLLRTEGGAALSALSSRCPVMLAPSPPCSITIWQHEAERHGTHATKIVTLEAPPEGPVELTRGTYLFEFSRPGHATVLMHRRIERDTTTCFQLTLPTEDAVPSGFVAIATASEPDAETDTLRVFAMQVEPVTCDDYLTFVNALDSVDGAEARARLPRYGGREYWQRNATGRFVLPASDEEGDQWLPRWPVFLVSQGDAHAYAAWLRERDGHGYRLPTSEEWLHAAQGGDRRPYPWGRAFDPTLCHMRGSRPGKPLPVPVGSCPSDTSPYGIKDCAGNIAQWTSTEVSERTYAVEGAAFNSLPVMCRLEHSMSAPGDTTLVHIGFRLMVDLQIRRGGTQGPQDLAG